MSKAKSRAQALLVGVDVHGSRGSVAAVLDADYRLQAVHWSHGESPAAIADNLANSLATEYRNRSLALGIDAPSVPLQGPRAWSWRRGRWRHEERSSGRHSELVLNTYGLARPQWTPQAADAPTWMRVGFALFTALRRLGDTYEVFPTASYRALDGRSGPRVAVDLGCFAHDPKDVLDAVMAAVTVGEFRAGRGAEVGGGDGLNTIILPAPLREDGPQGVLQWPED